MHYCSPTRPSSSQRQLCQENHVIIPRTTDRASPTETLRARRHLGRTRIPTVALPRNSCGILRGENIYVGPKKGLKPRSASKPCFHLPPSELAENTVTVASRLRRWKVLNLHCVMHCQVTVFSWQSHRLLIVGETVLLGRREPTSTPRGPKQGSYYVCFAGSAKQFLGIDERDMRRVVYAIPADHLSHCFFFLFPSVSLRHHKFTFCSHSADNPSNTTLTLFTELQHVIHKRPTPSESGVTIAKEEQARL